MMNWSEIDNKIVTVTANDLTTLLSDLAQLFDANEGFSVATLNLDHVVKFRNDSAFRKAYAEHSHVTADGNPVVWLSRLAGQSDVSLVPGSELIEPLLKLAAEKKVPVAFFGSSDATMEAVIRKTKQKFPNLEVVLAHSPPMGFDPDGQQAAHAIEMLHQSGARVVFLALGAPKQEKFAARAQKDLKHVGFLSIGAGLDFIAGTQKRAPAWVRMIASEWLWRMFSSPRRLFARYVACIFALPKLFFRALAARQKNSNIDSN